MISIYKNIENGLSALAEPTSGSWINVINPTDQELSFLQGLGVPADYLTYPLDLDERARTEREDGELLIVLRVPYYQGENADIPYATIPLGIILTDRHLITVCKRESDLIQEFLDGRVKGLSTAKRHRFVLRLLLNTATKYLYFLREINHHVDELEDRLQLSTKNRELLEILKYQKSLTLFTTALKSNELMMERLQRSRLFQTYSEDEDLLDDVITENQQAIEMTNIAINILSSMMDAFASIISNNLNGVMKFLASVTILLSVPTIITSFFGMNVHLPLENAASGALIIFVGTFLLSVLVTYIFWKRDWF
jgi:magnesium transporter